ARSLSGSRRGQGAQRLRRFDPAEARLSSGAAEPGRAPRARVMRLKDLLTGRFATDDDRKVTKTRWGKTPGADEEIRFLYGPQERRRELVRAIKIFFEFMRGFRTLHFVGPCVTVFGSARFRDDHEYYRMARDVGGRLARAGFTVMTGGGPGIMEAANRGAKEAGGRSIGCNIELAEEQKPHPHLRKWIHFRPVYMHQDMLE